MHAAASSSQLRGATTLPVLPIIEAESPTSIATQRTPQLIASPKTFGKSSPKKKQYPELRSAEESPLTCQAVERLLIP
jgi:hypothetical protein